MKGLTPRQSNDTVYLETKYFGICAVSRKPREGYEVIKVPDVSTGEEITKYVRWYDLEGMVTKIEWRDTKGEFDTRYRSWKVYVDAAGIPVVLEIKWKSGPCDAFMKIAPFVDWTKPVEFRAWQSRNQKTGKPQAAFALYQDGANVPRYKRGAMGECPEAVEDQVEGWDYSQQLRFLHTQMLNVIIPRVAAAAEIAKGQEQEPERGDAWEDDGSSDF